MSEHTAEIVEQTEVLFKRVKAAVSERLGSGPLCWAVAGPDEVHRAREMAETILNNWHNDQHQLGTKRCYLIYMNNDEEYFHVCDGLSFCVPSRVRFCPFRRRRIPGPIRKYLAFVNRTCLLPY